MKMRALMGLVMLFALMGCGARPAPPQRLTVMTYNIHLGVGMDRKLDLDRIADVINAAHPDLVAIQEVDQGTKRVGGIDEVAELARLTDLHAVYGPAKDHDGGKYGNVVLSRVPIISSRVVALPHNPGGQREPRSAVGVTCRLAGGAEIVFIGTHLDHTRENSDRLAQATAINEEWRDEERPAILAGDINCERGSPPLEALTREWTLASGPEPTFPADGPRRTIDHVFVKPTQLWRVLESRVIDEPVGSDHRPVLVKLELIPRKESQK